MVIQEHRIDFTLSALYPQRVSKSSEYVLVRLASGAFSLRSSAHQETFHPVIGPADEAETLYVRQLKIVERMQNHAGEFVVWDVGLGAAANAISVLRASRSMACPLRLLSFDCTLGGLQFGLEHAPELGYFHGYEDITRELVNKGQVSFNDGSHAVHWEAHIHDFPSLMSEWRTENIDGLKANRRLMDSPHAIFWDAYSPATNPAMWTQPLFEQVHGMLNPEQSCALATYSRSTQLRAALLLAGFFVGRGARTGEKEETTIAANGLNLIEFPLDHQWLARARRSTSAEPLWQPVYEQKPLALETWERLRNHAQFRGEGRVVG